jgi:hypothetical protein
VLSVETSEANNSVTIGVGPKRAPWRCLVKRGIVADVMSLTDEGKLWGALVTKPAKFRARFP